MDCSIPNIPKYLHFTASRKKYKPSRFRFYHVLYITGHKEKSNPIEFPNTSTAISTCWSKLINPKHVLQVVRSLSSNPDGRGNHVFFGSVRKIKKIQISEVYVHDAHGGKHTLSAQIWHTPLPCNYAHAEIMIAHTYFENGKSKSEVVTKSMYDDKKCLLRKKSHKAFFTPLILKYRAEMATMLNCDIKDLSIPFHFRILPKHLLIRIAIWKSTFFFSK